MKKIILCLIAVMFLSVSVFAEEKIAVITKQGNVYHWKDYYEKDNNICTAKSYGEMCIPKSEIKEITKGDKGEDKIIEEKRVDVGTLKEISVEDVAATQTKETKDSVLPARDLKLVQPDWSWVSDKSAKIKLQQERQQIINSYKTAGEKLNNEAQSRGLGTVTIK